MRVAFLTNFIPPYRKALFLALSKQVDHVRVFVSTPMERNRHWSVDWSGLDVIAQKTITLPARWRHPAGFAERLSIHLPIDTLPQLNRFRPHVVVSGEMGFRTFLAIVYRLFRPKSRLIVWADVSESSERGRGWLRTALRRMMHRVVDSFIVNGASGRRYLRSFGVSEEKIAVVPSTVDVSLFTAAPLERASNRLLFVGQLIERKGLLEFAEVLREWALKHPDRQVEWEIAGDGPLRAKLERFLLPANVRMILTGPKPYSDMLEIYARASVFVLPTKAESWGLVVNEAMAAGLPVLGSIESQAVEELVTDNVNGWTFRANDKASMYHALDACLNTPPARLMQMREAARQRASALSPDAVARDMYRAIKARWDANLVSVDANQSQPTVHRG